MLRRERSLFISEAHLTSFLGGRRRSRTDEAQPPSCCHLHNSEATTVDLAMVAGSEHQQRFSINGRQIRWRQSGGGVTWIKADRSRHLQELCKDRMGFRLLEKENVLRSGIWKPLSQRVKHLRST